MRKLIAVLCVVAMLLVATVPAFANPSITITVIPVTEGVEVTPLSDDLSEITDDTLRDIIEKVHSADHTLTPTEVVLAIKSPEAVDELREVENYSFTSRFNKITAPEFPMDIAFQGTTPETRIMLINMDTEEQLVVLLPNPDGTYTFPFEGYMALIDPTPAA